MNRKNIGYHTRLASDNRVKVVGGSFGGALDMATANRLVRAHFKVKVLDSGRAVFVDREGRTVSLYITIDPDMTEVGKEALKEYQASQQQKEKAEAQKEQHLREMLDCMSVDEALARLSGKA